MLAGRVATGEEHTCKLSTDNVAYCWGRNSAGQLGIGVITPFAKQPTAVNTALRFVTITAGEDYTCGLTSDGTAYCWGGNSFGELGDGTTQTRTVPAAVVGGMRFVSLVAGEYATCALTAAGAAYCWGANDHGRLGDGTTVNRLAPTPVATTLSFTTLALGSQVCGLTSSGQAYCWGDNRFGGLGMGDVLDRASPTLVAGGYTFAALSAGTYHVCALTRDGVAYCWGSNGSGELGQGVPVQPPASFRTTAAPVNGGFTFQSITAAGTHTCGISPDGKAYCWGRDLFGEAGVGSTAAAIGVPTAVVGGLVFQLLSAGYGHTCGITVENPSLYCWGDNLSGALGDATTIDKNRPTLITVP